VRALFPEREFFMRSQGQVRFIKITSRMQITAAASVLAVALGWSGSVGFVAVSQWKNSSDRAALLDREASVAKAQDRVDAYRENLAATTADLEKRQEFIEGMIDMLPQDTRAEETVSNSSSESERLISLVEESIPEASGLARIEARQLAFAEALTRYADRRAASAEDAIRKLGLDPKSVLVSAQRAMGGPLQLVSSEADGSMDPRFERLGLSMARMDALERGLDGIPQVMPADINSMSSGFGYRRDPFTGRSALHSGLDFAAPTGTPIHAAAAGTVSFVGNKSGYGRVVEIRHGNGLMTRYAHMSRWKAKKGDKVAAGDVIGAIGSTGRSTGPHLHFEVRMNDRAVNPRKFLEAAPHVLEEARAQFAGSDGATSG